MIHTIQTAEDYQNFIVNNKIALIDFWSTRCGPCRAFHSVLQKVSSDLPDSVQIATLNIDNANLSDIITEHQIERMPTVVYFADGKPVKQTIGLLSADDLKRTIEEVQK